MIKSRNSSKPATGGVGSSKSPFVEAVKSEFSKKLALSLVAVIGASSAFLSLGAWAWFEEKARSYVVSVVSEDIVVAGSKSAAAIDERVKKIVDGTIGSVNSGLIQLNDNNTQATLFVYLPPSHDGDLYVSLDGLEDDERVTMNTKSASKPFNRNATYTPISLGALLRAEPDPQSAAIVDGGFETMSGIMRDTYALTFVLSLKPDKVIDDSTSSINDLKSRVNLSYITLISPPIRRAAIGNQ
jgi:hypothetical protein